MLAACGQGAGKLPQHPAANANLPAQLTEPRGNQESFRQVPTSAGAEAVPAITSATGSSLCGRLDNGYSLPMGAATPALWGPHLHPDTGISAPFSLLTADYLTLQIQLLLRGTVSRFPLGCPKAKWPGTSGAALSCQAGAFCREGKQELANNQGWKQVGCLLSLKCSAVPNTGYHSHLNHTLKCYPSQSKVSTCQPQILSECHGKY